MVLYKFSLLKNNENTYQKGVHSCKCTELSLKRREGIGVSVTNWFYWDFGSQIITRTSY